MLSFHYWGHWLSVSKPQVIQREVDGVIHEPFEIVVIDIEEQHQGSIMEEMGNRKADLQSIIVTENGRMKLDFMAPSRGMIGFRSSFLTLTSGSGILTSIFDHYGPAKKGEIAETVLLPGDPMRAKWIAETFFKNPVCYNNKAL